MGTWPSSGGGGGSIVAGESPPDDTSVVWRDTSGARDILKIKGDTEWLELSQASQQVRIIDFDHPDVYVKHIDGTKVTEEKNIGLTGDIFDSVDFNWDETDTNDGNVNEGGLKFTPSRNAAYLDVTCFNSNSTMAPDEWVLEDSSGSELARVQTTNTKNETIRINQSLSSGSQYLLYGVEGGSYNYSTYAIDAAPKTSNNGDFEVDTGWLNGSDISDVWNISDLDLGEEKRTSGKALIKIPRNNMRTDPVDQIYYSVRDDDGTVDIHLETASGDSTSTGYDNINNGDPVPNGFTVPPIEDLQFDYLNVIPHISRSNINQRVELEEIVLTRKWSE